MDKFLANLKREISWQLFFLGCRLKELRYQLKRLTAKCKRCADTRKIVTLTDTVADGDDEMGFPVLRPCPACVRTPSLR